MRASIAGFLGRVRSLLYRYEARRALLGIGCATLALALVTPLIGWVIGERSHAGTTAVLGLASLFVILAVITAIVVGIIVPRRRFGDDRDVARWVGSQRRDIASDLLSAVELSPPDERPGAPSRALVEALLDDTVQRIDAIDATSLIDVGQLRRLKRWAIAGVVVNVLAVVIGYRVVVGGWHNLLAAAPAPFDGARLSSVPLVGDLAVTIEAPAYARRPPITQPSSSGDVRGLPGTVVTLHARVLVPSHAAEVVLESDREPPRTIAATVVGDHVTAHFTIIGSARYRFALTSPDQERTVEASPRTIEAEIDQPPTIQLLAPGEPLDVSNLRRVELAYIVEDDFGLTTAELVWEGGKEHGKKPIRLDAGGARSQGKFVWDIAELPIARGEIRYWLEARDNDNVGDANVGRSRELHLRVVSPRERHEEALARQQQVAEKLLKNLAGRLTARSDDDPIHREDLIRELHDATVELGSVSAALADDPHASEAMRKALSAMRDRLEKLAATEQRLLPKSRPPKLPANLFATTDGRLVGELEDDTLTLADWLDRERLEGVLDISDEIAAHQKRLADLLGQFAKSKDPRLLDEVERELRTLDRAYGELDKHRRGMAEDVLDQYVNRSAIQAQAPSCINEVRRLVRAGELVKAQQQLATCRSQHQRSSGALEDSLAALRRDKFTEEQKKLDEVMNELADVAKDQDDIASEANRIFEAYATKADEVAKDHKREASKTVSGLVERLRHRIAEIHDNGLTPFAKEELEIVVRRLADVDHMVDDGDLAEALGMAHQAKASLDTIASELEAALEDDPKSKWADATQRALDDIERARPIAGELIRELGALSPRPDQIMSNDDLRALDRLRRRQVMNRDRTKKLVDRTKQLSGDLPGDTSEELTGKLGGAVEHMTSADDRMKQRDPSGAREAARTAADVLAKARERARTAARQAQEGAIGDEPIRIPGAEEYRAPEKFREQLLEAMKKAGQAPPGYDDLLKRYYEELIK